MAEPAPSLDLPTLTIALLVVGALAYAIGIGLSAVAVYVADDNDILGDDILRATGTLVLQGGSIIAGAGMLWAAWKAQPSVAWFRIVYLALALALMFRIL